jgi:diacylglycerol kinase (ATP)
MIEPKKLINSFSYAFAGMRYAYTSDQNIRVHIYIAVLVLFLSFFFGLSSYEIGVVVLAIVVVLSAEMINTAIEKMADLITKEHRMEAKIAKDISSAMVLTAALGSVVVGVVVFLPHLIAFFV